MAITGGAMALSSIGASVIGGRSAARSASKGQRRGMRHEVAMFDRNRDLSNAMWERSRVLMQPYLNQGRQALGAESALLGLDGADAQQREIGMVENSPLFRSLQAQGEDALLQNASATGGLRGGNTQAMLAQFRPQMLNQAIMERIQNLNGITTRGANMSGQAAGISSGIGQNLVNMADTSGQRVAQGFVDRGNTEAASRMGMTQSLVNGIGQFGQMYMLGKTLGKFGGTGVQGTPQNTYGVLASQQSQGPTFGTGYTRF